MLDKGLRLEKGKEYIIHVVDSFKEVDTFKSNHLLMIFLEESEKGIWLKRRGDDVDPTPYFIPWDKIVFIKPHINR